MGNSFSREECVSTRTWVCFIKVFEMCTNTDNVLGGFVFVFDSRIRRVYVVHSDSMSMMEAVLVATAYVGIAATVAAAVKPYRSEA